MRAQRNKSTNPRHRAVEQRSADREKLVLRVGLIEQDGTSVFCLVKNISASGVMVRPYGDLSKARKLSLRVGDESPIEGAVLWSRDNMVGIKFNQTLNPQALLRIAQKMLAHRRRAAPRMVTDIKGTLTIGGKKRAIIICDLSMSGARVRTDQPVIFGETTIIDLPGLPSLQTCVRWSDGLEFGVSFHPPLPLQIVAELLAADQSAERSTITT